MSAAGREQTKETTQTFRLLELHLQLSLKKSQLSVISFINHGGEAERKQTAAFSLVLRSEQRSRGGVTMQ